MTIRDVETTAVAADRAALARSNMPNGVLAFLLATALLVGGCGRRSKEQPAEEKLKTVTNSIGVKFVELPTGSFVMGDHPQRSFRLRHPVTINTDLYVSVHELTQRQWRDVMDSEPWAKMENVMEGDHHPATFLTWADCIEFCNKLSEKEGLAKVYRISDPKGFTNNNSVDRTEMVRRATGDGAGISYYPAENVKVVPDWLAGGYRLPTEAEWEYACRAGSTGAYYWSHIEDASVGDYAWYHENTRKKGESYAHKVGSKKPNRWGLHDMSGNVMEWCWDKIEPSYYEKSPNLDPKGPEDHLERVGTYHVLRGGSWRRDTDPCQSSWRKWDEVIYGNEIGMRVVRRVISANDR